MSDPNQSTPKTKIITEVHGQAAPAAPDTDNVRTYIPGLAAQRSVGRMLIESGPSAGSSRPVYDGTNPIGRDAAQNRVALDVEDSYISRTGHAILNVDVARKAMSILDGGKANRVQVNGHLLTSEVSIKPTDVVQIGRTTVRFEFN